MLHKLARKRKLERGTRTNNKGRPKKERPGEGDEVVDESRYFKLRSEATPSELNAVARERCGLPRNTQKNITKPRAIRIRLLFGIRSSHEPKETG